MTHLPRSTRKALLAMRDDLLRGMDAAEASTDEGDKSELEEAGVSWPLEADDPAEERSHPDETPDPADGFR